MVDLPEGIEALRTSVTILTWNVWFDDFEFDNRAAGIFTICEQLNPDVICLQEVLPKFLLLLNSQTWVKSYKVSTDYLENTVEPYGVMILAKSSLKPNFSVYELNTVMDRKFVCAALKITDRELFVGTVHLESLKFKEIRRDQLVQISGILRNHEDTVLVGDFNFCSYRNFVEGGDLENNCLQEILPNHNDMWAAFWDSDENKGYTYDSERNQMITHEERMRYDRVMYNFAQPKAMTHRWWPQSIKLVGTESIRHIKARGDSVCRGDWGNNTSPLRAIVEDITAVLPSDHFGLCATFELHTYGPPVGKKTKDNCTIC
jgi:exonuclease III